MLRRHRRTLAVTAISLGGLVLAVFIALAAFSQWLNSGAGRQWAEARLSQVLNRPLQIGGQFSLAWDRSRHQPWYHLPTPVFVAEQVVVGNPAWASHTEFASASRLRVRIGLLPLLRKQLILQRLSLDDARLQFERNAQGQNNWQFGNPGTDGSSWQLQLQSVRLGATTLRYTDTGLDLDLEATLTAASADARDDATAFTLRGHYREAALAGQGTAGSLLSLVDPAVNYPFQLNIHAGEVYLDAQGHIGNLHEDPAVDLQVQVRGPSMALLYPLTGLVLPRTAPFETRGQLQGTLGQSQAQWHYRDFHGRMGESDIAGELTYQSRQPRPLLTAKVSSNQLQLVDLGPLIGLGPIPPDPASPDHRNHSAKRTNAPARVLPDLPFLSERWNDMDLALQYHANQVEHGRRTITRNLQTRIQLQDRQMRVDPLNFDIGGGQAQARFLLDGRQHAVTGQAWLSLHDIALEQVLGQADHAANLAGTLQGKLELQGHGNSLAALLGSGNGTLSLHLGAGHIRRSALELVALDLLNVALTKAFGDTDIPITCAMAEFTVNNGVAEGRDVQMQTHLAYLDITGSINLGTETLNLTVHPHTLAPRLFSLRSPIDIQGSFLHPRVKVQEGPLLLRAGAAAALAILAPPALALLPLTTLGSEQPQPCQIPPGAH